MARSKGFQGIVGRIKGTTWGTAIAAAALSGLEVESLEMGDAGTDVIEDMQITGRVTQREATAGNLLVKPSFLTSLRYEGNEKDIAQVFGTAGTPSTVDTSARLHVFKIKDNIDGIFNCLAYEYLKDVFVAEIASAKWTKLTISGKQGDRVRIRLEGIGFTWINNSATNTTTTIDTVTLPTNREFALFQQLVFWINDNSAAALDSTFACHIMEFELMIERAMEARVSTQFGNRTDEPIDTGFAKVSGSFTVPAIQNNSPGGNTAFDAEQVTLTRKKALLNLSSTSLAGAVSAPYFHKLWLPNLQIGKGRPGIPGPQGPTRQFPFIAGHVATAPTGFTSGYVDAVTWEAQSQNAVDALA